ncbi:hypothetical protein RFI_31032 [Reticulomyxa filosa]|uniref:RBR-type E3 ubiquitin transferase n=1 Tax=Reticulomyxa filosa TaxID=46433 RepID=X6LWT0_RETFI|nr:hypothetical protein RFI_31032 [Reticulomyxa filosa]|eukprot:ETO06363.1 hypothetical protein RFI_31032 [Reticulomyxa filosa]
MLQQRGDVVYDLSVDDKYSVPPLTFRNSIDNGANGLGFNEVQGSPSRRLSRRLSNQLIRPIGRRSSVTNIASFVTAPIAGAMPFLSRGDGGGMVQETFFCHICFMNNAVHEGLKLRNCNHTFCTDCIKGYWSSRIESGNVYLKCFHPIGENSEHCGKMVDELDILQTVDKSVQEKFHRFKENLENPNARQCPKCQHTQTGDPNHPLMACEQCNTQYCFYHSAAHPIEERCEAYESRMLKEDKLNQEVTKNAKGCPRCKYLIEKSGGCNHMKCIKCSCSFCWLCMQEIEDIPIPNHFKEGNSGCSGKQFEGMEGEFGRPPPRWLVVIVAFFGCIFALPALAIAMPLACVCFPCAWCCETFINSPRQQRECTFVNILGLLFLFISLKKRFMTKL